MRLPWVPDAFDQSHFALPGYRDQAEMLLRGLECNGLLLVDPDKRLLSELSLRVEGLSMKHGQQIRIRIEEIQKKNRKRVIVTERTKCNVPLGMPLLDAARCVQQTCAADTLIVDGTSQSDLQTKGCPAAQLTPLASYISSAFEQRRHYCHDQLPPIDKMPQDEFDDHMLRCTRFAQSLRFYDKQIGNGSSLGGFRLGIGNIIRLWAASAHSHRASLSIELYTCVQKTNKPTDTIYSGIRDSLVRRLVADFGIPITLFFKEDSSPPITHDRYLQTSSVAVSFSKGFDYADENSDGSLALHRCTTKIDNGAHEHLYDYRKLKDHKPPLVCR
jgi:hypothetical protein